MKPKTSGETSGPELQPQPHGGALLDGGVHGHRGAGGRPPSAIRQHCRGSFDQRVAVLEKIADDDRATVTDRLRAIDMLGKYGLGTRFDITSDDEKVDRNIDDLFVRIHTKSADDAEREGMPATAQWERHCARQIQTCGLRAKDVPKPKSVLREAIAKLQRQLELAPEVCPWDA